jgi:Tol biopolymer transport system component
MKLLLPEALVIVVLTQVGFPTLNGPYLGQIRPGPAPEIFAPGILSLGFHEHNIAISPDGTEIFFVAASSDFSRYLIMTTKLKNGAWTMPETAPFSGGRNDGAPAFSPDGKRLYFSSRRPQTADGTPAEDFDIWYVERKGDSWTDPVNLGGPVNTSQNEVNPSLMSDGTIVFQRIEKLGTLHWDLFMSSPKSGTYGVPERLPAPVNSEANEAGPFIAADGSYLLFQSNRAGGYGVMDLYVTYRTRNGGWSEPVNLGEKINSPFSDWGPVVSPDGKYIFFGSFRNVQPIVPESRDYLEYMAARLGTPSPGKGTLYWVEAKIIDALKPKERNVESDDSRDRIILEPNRRFGESFEFKRRK